MICAFVLYWSMASWSLRERGASRSARIARAVPWRGPTYEKDNLSNAAARSAFPLWTKIAAVRGSSMCAFCRNMSLTLPRASRTDMSTSKSVRTVGTCVHINVKISDDAALLLTQMAPWHWAPVGTLRQQLRKSARAVPVKRAAGCLKARRAISGAGG